MKRRYTFWRTFPLGAAFCLASCAAFIGCKENSDVVITDDVDVQGTSSDEDYSSWIKDFQEQMTQGGVPVAPGAFAAAGATGSAPAMFNFNAAGATGSAPAMFNFNAAGATGSAPAMFNFNAAAATGDAPQAFHFNPAAVAPKGAAPAALKLGAATDAGASSSPSFNFTEFAQKKAAADKAVVAAANTLENATVALKEATSAAESAAAVATDKAKTASAALLEYKNAAAEFDVAQKASDVAAVKAKEAVQQLTVAKDAAAAATAKSAEAAAELAAAQGNATGAAAKATTASNAKTAAAAQATRRSRSSDFRNGSVGSSRSRERRCVERRRKCEKDA